MPPADPGPPGADPAAPASKPGPPGGDPGARADEPGPSWTGRADTAADSGAAERAEMLVTFGHGTASADRIAELLHGAAVAAVVDIRIAPGSRRNPQAARSELERWLPARGIGYRWEKRLGGRRRAAPDSPDTAWREAAFRGYAGHMRTADFLAAIAELLDQATRERTTVMCSESLWWRCHRRLVADFVSVARQVPAWHLMHDGRLVAHQPTPGLRLRDDGLLVYDAGQPPLL